MSLIITVEYHPWQAAGRGAIAVQLSRRHPVLRWYPRWCVRGFNAGHREFGKVAIVSGLYRYRIDLLYGKDPRPLLVGKDEHGRPLTGGRIRTLAPNHYQSGQWFADRVWLHGMRETPETKPDYFTDRFIGSSACHGPPDRHIDELMRDYREGHSGFYLLIRPSEPIERFYRWFRHRLGNRMT
jgi:hypothetical protein